MLPLLFLLTQHLDYLEYVMPAYCNMLRSVSICAPNFIWDGQPSMQASHLRRQCAQVEAWAAGVQHQHQQRGQVARVLHSMLQWPRLTSSGAEFQETISV